MSLFSTLERWKSESRPALILERIPRDPVILTYAQLCREVSTLIPLFKPNTRVAVSLPICIESVLLLFAITQAGACCVPLNPDHSQSEFECFLSHKIDLFICRQPDAIAARELSIPVSTVYLTETGTVVFDQNIHIDKTILPEVSPQDMALILFTSGTTSAPKAVGLTHKNLLSSVENIFKSITVTHTDVTMNVMPLFHIHGIVASVLTALFAGGTVVFPDSGKFSARRFWTAIKEFKCTWFTAVPTIHKILLATPMVNSVDSLRFIRSSSSRLDPSVLARMEERYNVPVIEAYAMTETAYQITSNPCDRVRRKPGSVGFPHGSVSLKIFDSETGREISQVDRTGEVCVQGPNVMSGYLDNTAANRMSFLPNNFFRTGDVGFLDADGYLTITGRLKEQINRGGEKISPLEIEEVAKLIPNVEEAVSFGIPDEKYGEVVALALVPKPRCELDMDAVQVFLKSRLATFKVPSRIFVAESLPKTGAGKVKRSCLANLFVARCSSFSD